MSCRKFLGNGWVRMISCQGPTVGNEATDAVVAGAEGDASVEASAAGFVEADAGDMAEWSVGGAKRRL